MMYQHKGRKETTALIVTSIIGAFFLIWPAIYNGYPLVNPDTGSYLSAFIPAIPSDRPMTYSFIVRLISLNGLSLWAVVYLQGYIITWLILRIVKHTTNSVSYLLPGLLITIFLALDTSLSWTVSQVQPDISTAIAFMSLWLILIQKENKVITIYLYVLYFFAVGSHFSHLSLFVIILAILFFFRKKLIPAVPRKVLGILLLVTLGTYITMSAALAKSQHAFIMATLVDQGILKPYLEEHCATEHYKLCDAKDSLPMDGDSFLWDTNSALNKAGWGNTKTEYNKIIRGTFTEPKYLLLHLRTSLKGTIAQLFRFNIGEGNDPINKASYAGKMISRYMPKASNAFFNDKQNSSYLANKLYLPNQLFIFIIYLSLAVLALMFIVKNQTLSDGIILFLSLSMIIIILNAWDCGTFSQVHDRYGSKLIWLIPFCTLLVLAHKPEPTIKNNNFSAK